MRGHLHKENVLGGKPFRDAHDFAVIDGTQVPSVLASTFAPHSSTPTRSFARGW
jgi:hypothetical protein